MPTTRRTRRRPRPQTIAACDRSLALLWKQAKRAVDEKNPEGYVDSMLRLDDYLDARLALMAAGETL